MGRIQRLFSFGSNVRLSRLVFIGLMLVLAWAPALLTASLMNRYAVNIPVWDDFERAELLDRYEQGTLDFEFLAAAHIEHRILLPRLIILANARFGDGSIRNEVVVNFMAMFISSVALAVLLWKTRPGRHSNWLLIFLMNLCVFSLLQYQNLCWAIQTAFFLPLTFLALLLVVLRSSLKLPWKFLLALLCALGGTASFSHGLVLWPLVAVYFLFCANDWSWKKRIGVVLLWSLVALAVGVLYFSGISSTSHYGHSYLQKPGEYPPGVNDILSGNLSVFRVVASFLIALGSHYSRYILMNSVPVSLRVGAGIALLFSALALTSVIHCVRKRSREEWNNLLPWLALGGYAIFASLMVSLGRSTLDTDRTLTPRYLTISLYLSVSLIALSALVVPAMVSSQRARARLRTAGCFLVGVFFVLQSWNWLYGYRGLQHWNAARWQSLSEHLFRDFSHTEHPDRLDYSMDYAREQIDRLQGMGYLHLPEPITRGDFSRFTVSQSLVDWHYGHIVRVAAVAKPVCGWRVSGFSALRKHMKRVPDAVLFTVGDEEERMIVGFAEPTPAPLCYLEKKDFEFSDLAVPSRETRNAWSGYIREEQLVPWRNQPVEITVWAVDLKEFRAYQHQETFTILPGDKNRSNYDRPWKGATLWHDRVGEM